MMSTTMKAGDNWAVGGGGGAGGQSVDLLGMSAVVRRLSMG